MTRNQNTDSHQEADERLPHGKRRSIALAAWLISFIALTGAIQTDKGIPWTGPAERIDLHDLSGPGVAREWAAANWFTAVTKYSELNEDDTSNTRVDPDQFPRTDPELIATVSPGIFSTHYVLIAFTPNVSSKIDKNGKYISAVGFLIPSNALIENELLPCEYDTFGISRPQFSGAEASTAIDHVDIPNSNYSVGYRMIHCQVTALTTTIKAGQQQPNQVTLRYSIPRKGFPALSGTSFEQRIDPDSILGLVSKAVLPNMSHKNTDTD